MVGFKPANIQLFFNHLANSPPKSVDRSEGSSTNVNRALYYACMVWVCMHRCGCVCMGVGVYVWVWLCMHGCMYAWVCMCMHGCGCVCMGVGVYAWVWVCMYGCGCVCMGVCMHGGMGVYVYAWVCMGVGVYAWMHGTVCRGMKGDS